MQYDVNKYSVFFAEQTLRLGLFFISTSKMFSSARGQGKESTLPMSQNQTLTIEQALVVITPTRYGDGVL